MHWRTSRVYFGPRWPLLIIPRFYTRWDYGRCKGLSIVWLRWTFQIRTEINW